MIAREKNSNELFRPQRIGIAVVDMLQLSTGLVRVDYTATLRNIPRYGAFFDWSGHDLGNVTCRLSNGERPIVQTSRSRIVIAVPPSSSDDTLVVYVSYTLRPGRLHEVVNSPSVIEEFNFPQLRSRANRPAHVSPFTSAPDTIVRARSELAGVTFLGPSYRVQPDGEFAFYEGLTPFSLIFGRFKEIRDLEISLLEPKGSSDSVDISVVREVSQCGAAVRHHLEELFSDSAIKHRAIVLLPWPASPSCAGSAVLLSVIGSQGDQGVDRKALVESLAHEYAHAWWSYSVFWNDPRVHELLNELLAVVLTYDYARVLDPSAGIRNTRLWSYAAVAIRRSEKELVKRISTPSAAYAASLLIDVAFWHRERLVAMLRELWNEGHERALSAERLYAAISRNFSSGVADVLRDALIHPRPIIAKTRVIWAGSSHLALVIRPPRKRMRALRRRLEIVGYVPDQPDSRPRTIAITAPKERIGELFRALEPSHMVFQRSARLMAIHSRPWLARLWAWAGGTSRTGTMSEPQDRPTLFVRSCLAVFMNREDPAGWHGLSIFFASRWPSVARWCAVAAARRVSYPGEEHLLQPLASDEEYTRK